MSIAPPAKLLTNGTFDELRAWTEQVLEENQGGELAILYHLEPQYPLATLRAWRTWLLKMQGEKAKTDEGFTQAKMWGTSRSETDCLFLPPI